MTNKDIVSDFLQLVISGKVQEAYAKYIDMEGKHHNVFNPTGFLALQKGMEENNDQAPNKQFIIKHIVEEWDIVVTHSHLIFNPGELWMIAMHIFRLHDGKIAEMRDCGQAIPENSPNSDGAF